MYLLPTSGHSGLYLKVKAIKLLVLVSKNLIVLECGIFNTLVYLGGIYLKIAASVTSGPLLPAIAYFSRHFSAQVKTLKCRT